MRLQQEARDALSHKLVDALKEYKLLGGARHNFGFNLSISGIHETFTAVCHKVTKTLALKGAKTLQEQSAECS